jgi:hypothetical protein
MKLWILKVLDQKSADWEASTHKGEVIVRAVSENSARNEASKEFFIATKHVKGETVKANPWSQSELVSCNEYSGCEYQVEGQSGVLIPS